MLYVSAAIYGREGSEDEVQEGRSRSNMGTFSPQHRWSWLQPRAAHDLPGGAGSRLPLAACPHAGAISTSPSPAEKKKQPLCRARSPKPLSSGRNVCSQQVSRPGARLGLNKSPWDVGWPQPAADGAGGSPGCRLRSDVRGWLSRAVEGHGGRAQPHDRSRWVSALQRLGLRLLSFRQLLPASLLDVSA